MARPLPKTNAPAFVKKSRISQRTLVCARRRPRRRAREARRSGADQPKTGKREPQPRGGALTSSTRMPARRKNSASSACATAVTTNRTAKMPQSSGSLAVDLARQLVGGDGDDADDRGGDAVEDGLHPPQAAERHVERRQREHHQKRRQHKRQPDQRGAQDAVGEVADRDGELGCQGAGHDLGERQAELVLLVVDPAAALDQVALHVADKRDRPAEADRTQLQEISGQLPERASRRPYGLCVGCLDSDNGAIWRRHRLRRHRSHANTPHR